MTCLSVDAVSEIISYLDMPTLRKMIDISDKMEHNVSDVFSLEFYRRGEKFVNWINGLRVVREDTDEEITYISENVRIIQSSLPSGDHSLSRITTLDGVEMASTRWWNREGMMRSSLCYKDGGKLHGLCEEWNYQGVKTSSYNYKDGKLHGLCEQWDNLGVKRSSTNYKDGKLHGLCKRWNYQGVMKSSGNYENGCYL